MDGAHSSRCSRDGAGSNLARLRSRASEFFENLSVTELAREAHRHLWVSEWSRIADDYRIFAESARDDGSVWISREAWLCSLTALEIARSLSCLEDSTRLDLADKAGIGLRGFEDDAGQVIERVKIDGFDQEALTGLFLPACRREPGAPALICVGDDEGSLASMMSRLWPAALCRNVSLLLVHARTSAARRSFKPEHVLQCWLDYLEARPDVDGQRISVYGEGMCASDVSRLALYDRRIAAAVCDGGLLASVKRRASVHWMTGAEQTVRDGASTGSLLPSRQIACPLLMVVGSRSMVREAEALELQAGYRHAGAACSVVVPNRIPYPLGEIENFISVDDFIFQWLDSKLGTAGRIDPVTYL